MAKFLVAVAATAASMVSASLGDPWMYTLTGACDAQNDVNGMTFVKQGNTLSGAPYYKALRAEKYLYHEPDCQDGAPRWVLDAKMPDVNKTRDLDGDGSCDYIGQFQSQDTSHPPAAGEWTMLCDGVYEKQYLILLEGTSTTTTTLAKASTSTTTSPKVGEAGATEEFGDGYGTKTTTTTKNTKTSLMLGGACPYKATLNGLTFDVVGTAADGSPIYKARGIDEYIYHDADCDGAGNVTAARWVVDNSKPNSTATKDLDGDGKCTYHARLDSTGGKMLPTSATWRMYCGPAEGWVSLDLTLKEASGKDFVFGNTMVSSAERGGMAASVAALSLAIMQALFA
mmetsp:Transcript_16573/g.45846  ORF Transcript_16573/g.45846 Transcript_16573/m.45846 type:complete len:341 (+) Transcript_16573:94-1116(+)